ncbi:MAG: type II CAAX prenyl endopeptidase Rce1 family protein [Erythrobacter sp.]
MPEGRARALFSSQPLPRLSPWARARDALRFVARPTPYAARHPWSLALVTALASLFVLHLAIDWAATWLLETGDGWAGFLPLPRPDERPQRDVILSAVVLAPVLEEALHRGWLSGRIAALRFAAFGFAATGCMLLGLTVGARGEGLLTLAGVVIALVGFAQWLITRKRDTAVPAWFTRHFALVVWGGSLVFGVLHLGIYQPVTHPLGLLVVAPQLIGGLLLAYVRTRLGLRAAMLHHAAYNALFLTGEAWPG